MSRRSSLASIPPMLVCGLALAFAAGCGGSSNSADTGSNAAGTQTSPAGATQPSSTSAARASSTQTQATQTSPSSATTSGRAGQPPKPKVIPPIQTPTRTQLRRGLAQLVVCLHQHGVPSVKGATGLASIDRNSPALRPAMAACRTVLQQAIGAQTGDTAG